MFSKKTDKLIKRAIILGLLWFVALVYLLYSVYSFSIENIGFSPIQPIKFSHLTHSGKFEIKCLYCHFTAENSAYSAIPSTHSCMVCHIALKNESPLIKSLNISFDDTTKIFWNNIYRVPDYAIFNHSRHIRNQIDCSSCHGQVETMDSVYQSTAITMKWCLECHRNPSKLIIPARQISGIFKFGKQNLSLDNLDKIELIGITEPIFGMYFSEIPKSFMGIFLPKLPGRGPENCSSCHY